MSSPWTCGARFFSCSFGVSSKRPFLGFEGPALRRWRCSKACPPIWRRQTTDICCRVPFVTLFDRKFLGNQVRNLGNPTMDVRSMGSFQGSIPWLLDAPLDAQAPTSHRVGARSSEGFHPLQGPAGACGCSKRVLWPARRWTIATPRGSCTGT